MLTGQFWMGDLNYRIDMPDDILSTWVEEKKYSQILDKDQVRFHVLLLMKH